MKRRLILMMIISSFVCVKAYCQYENELGDEYKERSYEELHVKPQNIISNEVVEITNGYLIGNLEIMKNDIGFGDINMAKRQCKQQGIDWRLPNEEELKIIYENKNKLGVFSTNYYWGEVQKDSYPIATPYKLNISTGQIKEVWGNEKAAIRPVKTIQNK